MVGVPPARENEENRLNDSRSEFVASLPRRLDVLRAGLAQLAEAPADRERLNGMLRRLHALASSARVLGFASVAEVLGEAERTLRRAPRAGTAGVTLKEVGRALDLLPSLVVGPASPVPAGSPVEASSDQASPLGILVFGPAGLASALAAEAAERFELEHTEDAERAREFAQSSGPDAIVIDADLSGARELVELLRADPLVERAPIIGVGSFVSAEAAAVFAAAGADRILQKPVSPEVLRRTLLELGELSARTRGAREPLGDLTVEDLADRIAREVRKGLVDSLESSSQSRVALGDGADVLGAVWGAVARVRELVTLRSSGNIRFQPVGPEGAIPLAPWVNDERRAGDRGAQPGRAGEEVALKGRRIVVADDDPAVVWFLSGLLKAVGAEVLEAHDGERALECVFASWPDLVVSDVLMPRRDGFSLCHEIKRDVVARDVPVILLSWKEDLLQRVRELGGGADGYLRKEATASTVVERVREVLRPRARIEQRLKVGGEVKGRLDGVTPRLVLELVSKLRPDSTVTIRDAVYLYEIHLRGGQLRSLTRSAADGSFDRGPAVLSALLGVSAGRFVVQADTTPCRSEFHATLPELFEAPVRKARAALAALAAERLPRVSRVELELAGMARYLECTPEPARKLVERIAAGAAPAELLLSGEASAWLLEAVLSDLARRGAVGAVEVDEPAPRTAVGGSAGVDSLPAAASVDSAWSEPPRAPELAQGPVAQTSARDVSDASASAEPFVAPEHAADFREGPRTQSSALEALSPEAAPAAEAGWFGGAGLHVPDVAAAAPAAPAPASASQAAKPAPAPPPPDQDIDAMFAEFAESPVDPPKALEAPREVTPIGLGPSEPKMGESSRAEASRPGASERSTETPSRVGGVRPVLRMPRGSEPPSPSMADVFAAALAESPPESPSLPPVAISPQASAEPPVEARPLLPLRGSGSKPRLAATDPRRETELEGAPVARIDLRRDAEPEAPRAARVDPRREPEAEPEPTKAPPAAATDAAAEDAKPAPTPAKNEAESAPTKPAGEEPVKSQPAIAGAAAPDSDATKPPPQTVTLDPDATKPPPGAVVREPKPTAERGGDARVVSSPADSSSDSSSDGIRAAAAAGASAGRSATPAPAATRAAKPAAAAAKPAAGRSASTSQAKPAKPSRPESEAREERGGDSIWRWLGVAVLAGVGAFTVVHWLVVPALAPRETVEVAPSPSAIVAAVQAPNPPLVKGPTLHIEPLTIPAGADPGPGKGFIDVVGTAEDQLYVDGTFVGRGPSRSVPVLAGSHEVRILRGESAHTTTVTLAAGKRLRVRLEDAPRPSPSH